MSWTLNGQQQVNKSWTVLEDPGQSTSISMCNKYLILGFISDAFHQLSAKFIQDLLIGIYRTEHHSLLHLQTVILQTVI